MTPAASDIVGFLLRELAQPDSPVLDRLYDTLVAPRHAALCGLWAAATGAAPDSEDTRLAVFALIGQAAYFRLAAPIVQRRMGWDGYARREARAISRLPVSPGLSRRKLRISSGVGKRLMVRT